MSRSEAQQTYQPLLSDEELKRRMQEISNRFPMERKTMKDAYQALAKREARTLLAITFLEPDMFHNVNAKGYVERAKTEGIKLTVGDKEAIIALELETEKVAYDLAKFDCETSEKDFAKLQPQLSYLQSEMKLI